MSDESFRAVVVALLIGLTGAVFGIAIRLMNLSHVLEEYLKP